MLANVKTQFYRLMFKAKHPKCKVFQSEERMLYSQDNQDYIVNKYFFRGKKDGFYCDVGGNHPLYINNTRFFEENGWKGIVFEPLPYMQEIWKKYRAAKFFPYGASNEDAEATLTVVKNTTGWEDMLSFVADTRSSDYGYETENISIQLRQLKNIFLEEHIEKIDYMSIDVEGHEFNVIKGIDFSSVIIDVLTIENNSNSFYGDDSIRLYLLEEGYVFWGRIEGLDDIFVRQEFLKSTLGAVDKNELIP
jgi:FkbM family methyltransferase